MTKLLPFFWMISSTCAMCVSGFIAAQNLTAQMDGMMGGMDLVLLGQGVDGLGHTP